MAVTANRIQRLVSKRLQEHRLWLERNTTFHKQQIEYFEQSMRDMTLTSLDLLAACTQSLALFYGTRGVIALHDRQEGGWVDVTGAVECYLWSARLQLNSYYSRFGPDRRMYQTMLLRRFPRVVNLLSYFIAVEDHAREQETWRLVQKVLEDDDKDVIEWWNTRRYEPLLITLYANSGEVDPSASDSNGDLGVYGGILKAWHETTGYEQALSDACDYHCKVMFGTDSDWDAEFDRPPFDLVPVDIFAINCLRVRAGLAPAEPKHPLMTIIGRAEPASFPRELGTIFASLQMRFNEFFPSQ